MAGGPVVVCRRRVRRHTTSQANVTLWVPVLWRARKRRCAHQKLERPLGQPGSLPHIVLSADTKHTVKGKFKDLERT